MITNDECFLFLVVVLLGVSPAQPRTQAQQTLGGITGTVTDSSGAVDRGRHGDRGRTIRPS